MQTMLTVTHRSTPTGLHSEALWLRSVKYREKFCIRLVIYLGEGRTIKSVFRWLGGYKNGTGATEEYFMGKVLNPNV